MLEDKRKDLASEKQKRLLQRLVEELSQTDRDLYYRSTADIAAMIERHVAQADTLNAEDRALMQRLSRRDIEVLLSLH